MSVYHLFIVYILLFLLYIDVLEWFQLSYEHVLCCEQVGAEKENLLSHHTNSLICLHTASCGIGLPFRLLFVVGVPVISRLRL